MDVASNLQTIQKNIAHACQACQRKKEDITIIAVTKYVTIERTEETLQAGITDLGENRLEGFLEKYNHFHDRANWHFIGTLQSRKVKDVINHIDVLHSLDRISLAKEIEKRANKQIDCFIQVNVSGEESKHGVRPEALFSFIEKLKTYSKIRVIGLMTMAPHIKDEARLRSIFRHLATLRNDIHMQNLIHAPCNFLSMGMSNDYTIAVEEGATHIRVGTNLVG
ncbi:YggS family pyridoxal phosphate-dependent enzyme [Virgibacillus sp. Bac330]|uniref:YggS family pyridoxal phosphate-dependent enzyme n=1 Tax=Virgibacillus sp. Bac330 TaxID=2419841 RepID=UPI000EF4FBE9|nr:YggS family pyridoxal phosphate-dependent enzyme [Virgibacillus sp. Bac330]